MAAAVTLAEAGAQVTVFEAARTLGGRARRVDYNGVALDNGLHILIGAYHETLRLIRMVSDAPDERRQGLVRQPLDLHIPGHFRMRAPALPAPLHLALALLWCDGLSLSERLRAARFMTQLRAMGFRLDADTSVAQLLARFRQGPDARRFLWEPLCVSALNTPPERASAQVFLNVLRDSLNGTRADSELILPGKDLSALFPEPAARYVEARNGRVHIGVPVETISADGTGFIVETSQGRQSFDRIVCALPPTRVASVLGDLRHMQGVIEAVHTLRYEPICSVYLQYSDHARLPQPMLGLQGGYAQWAFDRGTLMGQHGLIGVVISARGAHQELEQSALANAVADELKAAWPQLGAPRWAKVVAEKRATFACEPVVQRPDQVTPVPGLYLAGDYTASPYPGTLEAAVRSGVRCARLALATESAMPADA